MEVKEKITEVWKKVLEKEQIGNSDNIMDIGGDSLKIYKISSLLNDQYGMNVSAMDIMMYSTINDLTGFVENKSGNGLMKKENAVNVVRPVRRAGRRRV